MVKGKDLQQANNNDICVYKTNGQNVASLYIPYLTSVVTS
jgi:hypothetical protein